AAAAARVGRVRETRRTEHSVPVEKCASSTLRGRISVAICPVRAFSAEETAVSKWPEKSHIVLTQRTLLGSGSGAPSMKKQFLVPSFLSLVVGCSPHGTIPLPQSSVSARVMNATDRGPVPADQLFDLVVGVRMRNESRLPLVHKQLADNSDALSPDEFG